MKVRDVEAGIFSSLIQQIMIVKCPSSMAVFDALWKCSFRIASEIFLRLFLLAPYPKTEKSEKIYKATLEQRFHGELKSSCFNISDFPMIAYRAKTNSRS